jgi:tetratricopeptide (TPR) repeat protein
MSDWFLPLLRMFYAPSRAMAEVRDRAPLGPAVVLAFLAQSALLTYALWPTVSSGIAFEVGNFLSIARIAAEAMLFIAVGFVPIAIFVANLFERRGSFGIALAQEYAAMASAAFYARAAACLAALPLLAASRWGGFEVFWFEAARRDLPIYVERGWIAPEELPGLLMPERLLESWAYAVTLPFFALGLFFAVREVFRFSWPRALATLTVSGVMALFVSGLFARIFSFVLGSPLLLILFLLLMRGYIGEVMRGHRARSAFKHNLEAATLNPADASAHYNLGLIHLHRKEIPQARERFERAIEIDSEEVDSHYQLGRIARSEGRFADAIKHFEQVVVRDPSHAQQELWREIGATYIHAGQFGDAQDALERFLDKRQSDPEGLYLMGRAFFGQGRLRETKEWMQACVEAVRTAPAYKYRTEKRWLNEAQQFLRSLA